MPAHRTIVMQARRASRRARGARQAALCGATPLPRPDPSWASAKPRVCGLTSHRRDPVTQASQSHRLSQVSGVTRHYYVLRSSYQAFPTLLCASPACACARGAQGHVFNRFLCASYAIMFLCDSFLPSFASRRAPLRASRNQVAAGSMKNVLMSRNARTCAHQRSFTIS